MSVVDWESKPEPWRSVGLNFVHWIETGDCRALRELGGPSDRFFGSELRAARLAKGMTQSEVERAAGISHSMLWMMEANRTPGRKHRDAIAAVLDVSVTDIWPE